jgi:hypothetical protein
MTSYPAPMCVVCVHRNDDGSCAAYPDGIPNAIYLEGAEHRKPYPGDHGITFTPVIDKWSDEDVAVIMERYDKNEE